MRSRRIAFLLAVLGLSRMLADLAGMPALAAVAGATSAAPAPKVFSSQRGLETYSSRFFIEWSTATGEHAVELTPELGARLVGPYNRRNVYGAALAYGPLLASDPRTAPLFHSVQRAALCGDAPLLAELGIATPGRVGPVRIRVVPLARLANTGSDLDWPTLLVEDCR
jgi:hypothetical protein